VPQPPRERLSASRAARSAGVPLSSRIRRLLVRADRGAVEERHAEFHTARLGRCQHALPDAELAPAFECLRCHPPGAEFGRDGAPSRPVPVPPDDRIGRAAQVVVLRAAARAHCLDQRREPFPLRVRKNPHRASIRHAPKLGPSLKG